MRMILKMGILLSICFSLSACLVTDSEYSKVAPGVWRATLKLTGDPLSSSAKIPETLQEVRDKKLVDIISGDLPFNFVVGYNDDESFYVDILNGEESIRVNDIEYWRDRATAHDTIQINFPLYDSYIKAIVRERAMQGEWIVPARGNYSIPFVANFGDAHRFSVLRKKPATDITGKWEVEFTDDSDSYKAIGDFKQDGNNLTGTFVTETGDYRFLEGTVQQDKIYLSTFDGAHAFLFEAKIMEDETLIGTFRSGKHYQSTWTARKNPNFELSDPNELTFLKEGYDKVDFAFENADGKTISISDDAYKGKVKIVQILGTWCPNCKDETQFLVNYLSKNPNKDLAVIGLAFEKYKEPAKSKAIIKKYQERMNVPYEVLAAGYYNKKEAVKALPMLNHIMSYPTMIFIDKNDQIRRIHTGFAGPATDQFDAFSEDFKIFINDLLAE